MNRTAMLGPATVAFLLITITGGTILRALMAGVDLGLVDPLDWRRAHSHLGFYGVLFPAAWACFSSLGLWVPGGRWLFFYRALVVVAVVGFLLQGYGFLATASSAGILAFWIFGAWKNRAFPGARAGRPFDSVPLSTLIAAAAVPAIAIASKRAPDLMVPTARFFMAMLLLGVFVPAVLSRPKGRARPILWSVLSVFAAASASEIGESIVFRAGAAAYALLVAVETVDQSRSGTGFPRWLTVHWLVFAAGFVSQTLGLIPGAHAAAIAGLHFLVLGPILLTLFVARLRRDPPASALIFYQGALAAMIAAVFVQPWFPENTLLLQKIAAASGVAIFAAVAFGAPLSAGRTRKGHEAL